jgi:hypothetical protein
MAAAASSTGFRHLRAASLLTRYSLEVPMDINPDTNIYPQTNNPNPILAESINIHWPTPQHDILPSLLPYSTPRRTPGNP